MKRCEHKDCSREAAGMVVVELVTNEPGVFPALPWQWRCCEHACPVPPDVMRTFGEEFQKRVPGLGDRFRMNAGLSKLTEAQVAELRHEAVDEGRIVRGEEGSVDVDYMTVEEARREIARHS
jgi:hypothetical protein